MKVIVWSTTVDPNASGIITMLHSSEQEAFDHLRENYAKDFAGTDQELIDELTRHQGIVLYIDSHVVDADAAPIAGPLHPAKSIQAETVADLPTREDLYGPYRLHELPLPEDRNQLRACFAAKGVRAYGQEVGLFEYEEPVTAMGDLLSDMRHLADALGLDWDYLVGRPDLHYADEVTGQDGY